jgi:hypothetical protein
MVYSSRCRLRWRCRYLLSDSGNRTEFGGRNLVGSSQEYRRQWTLELSDEFHGYWWWRWGGGLRTSRSSYTRISFRSGWNQYARLYVECGEWIDLVLPLGE